MPGLVNWLDRNIPYPDLTRPEATLFIGNVLARLMESRGLGIEQLAREKHRFRDAFARKIDLHR